MHTEHIVYVLTCRHADLVSNLQTLAAHLCVKNHLIYKCVVILRVWSSRLNMQIDGHEMTAYSRTQTRVLYTEPICYVTDVIAMVVFGARIIQLI